MRNSIFFAQVLLNLALAAIVVPTAVLALCVQWLRPPEGLRFVAWHAGQQHRFRRRHKN